MHFPAGTYYVSLIGNGYSIGTYRVQLTEVLDHDSDIRALTVGGSATGTLDFVGDEDAFEVTLTADETYEIEIVPLGTTWENGSKPFVSKDKDVGASQETIRTSLVRSFRFTAATTGVHHLSITGKTIPHSPYFAYGEYRLTVTETEPVPTAPPSPPLNLTAVANPDGSVTLNWGEPEDESVTGYQIIRRIPSELQTALLVYEENTNSTDTTYTDTDPISGKLHAYRVKAIKSVGRSKRSNYVEVTPNSVATGAPVITGSKNVGQALTADTSVISD